MGVLELLLRTVSIRGNIPRLIAGKGVSPGVKFAVGV